MESILTKQQEEVIEDICSEIVTLVLGPGKLSPQRAEVVEKLKKLFEVQIVEIRKIREERRGFQIMARNMMMHANPGFWLAAMEEGKYDRASGEAECSVCRQVYMEHPQLTDLPTFHMLCSGEIVKT
jgi:hypothetical protein